MPPRDASSSASSALVDDGSGNASNSALDPTMTDLEDGQSKQGKRKSKMGEEGGKKRKKKVAKSKSVGGLVDTFTMKLFIISVVFSTLLIFADVGTDVLFTKTVFVYATNLEEVNSHYEDSLCRVNFTVPLPDQFNLDNSSRKLTDDVLVEYKQVMMYVQNSSGYDVPGEVLAQTGNPTCLQMYKDILNGSVDCHLLQDRLCLNVMYDSTVPQVRYVYGVATAKTLQYLLYVITAVLAVIVILSILWSIKVLVNLYKTIWTYKRGKLYLDAFYKDEARKVINHFILMILEDVPQLVLNSFVFLCLVYAPAQDPNDQYGDMPKCADYDGRIDYLMRRYRNFMMENQGKFTDYRYIGETLNPDSKSLGILAVCISLFGSLIIEILNLYGFSVNACWTLTFLDNISHIHRMFKTLWRSIFLWLFILCSFALLVTGSGLIFLLVTFTELNTTQIEVGVFAIMFLMLIYAIISGYSAHKTAEQRKFRQKQALFLLLVGFSGAYPMQEHMEEFEEYVGEQSFGNAVRGVFNDGRQFLSLTLFRWQSPDNDPSNTEMQDAEVDTTITELKEFNDRYDQSVS